MAAPDGAGGRGSRDLAPCGNVALPKPPPRSPGPHRLHRAREWIIAPVRTGQTGEYEPGPV